MALPNPGCATWDWRFDQSLVFQMRPFFAVAMNLAGPPPLAQKARVFATHANAIIEMRDGLLGSSTTRPSPSPLEFGY
jgi:hypothetical protein